MSTEENEPVEQRFASLEEASRILSGDVVALNETLKIVAAMQAEQQQQKLRVAETERKMAQTKLEAAQRDRRNRQAIMGVAGAMAVLLPLVSMLVYLSLIMHVNSLLDSTQRDRFANCQIRNNATQSNINREEALGRLEKDPEIRALHLDSAQGLRQGMVDCSTYKR